MSIIVDQYLQKHKVNQLDSFVKSSIFMSFFLKYIPFLCASAIFNCELSKDMYCRMSVGEWNYCISIEGPFECFQFPKSCKLITTLVQVVKSKETSGGSSCEWMKFISWLKIELCCSCWVLINGNHNRIWCNQDVSVKPASLSEWKQIKNSLGHKSWPSVVVVKQKPGTERGSEQLSYLSLFHF